MYMRKKLCSCSLRAYVEFYKPPQITNVLHEVTLALFLGQQPSQTLELSVYPAEQIELHARSRNVTHLKYARYACLCLLLGDIPR